MPLQRHLLVLYALRAGSDKCTQLKQWHKSCYCCDHATVSMVVHCSCYCCDHANVAVAVAVAICYSSLTFQARGRTN
jgi:hypothetical protein